MWEIKISILHFDLKWNDYMYLEGLPLDNCVLNTCQKNTGLIINVSLIWLSPSGSKLYMSCNQRQEKILCFPHLFLCFCPFTHV